MKPNTAMMPLTQSITLAHASGPCHDEVALAILIKPPIIEDAK
jgi:hypothetical protein